MNKCTNPECFIQDTGQCHRLIDPIEKCPEFQKDKDPSTQKAQIKPTNVERGANNLKMPWDGGYLTPDTLSIVTTSSSPYVIGLVGNINAGKTSFLATLFTLLLNQSKLKGFEFSGSYTLDAWDQLAYTVKFNNGTVQYPNPTSSNPNFYSLFHLRLKAQLFKDILFADGSGEVFAQWAANINDSNVDSAKWIDSNSNAFIFFIDCDSLVKRKATAMGEILDVAYRLKDTLGDRPVAVAFSKGDVFSKINRALVKQIEDEIDSIFENNKRFKISNFSFSNSDVLCHINNIEMINWILKQISSTVVQDLKLNNPLATNKDYFFQYGQ